MSTIPSRSIGLLCAWLALGALPLLAQFSQTSYTLDAPDCSSEVSICSGYSEQQFDAYTFMLDGAAYAKTFRGCNQVSTWAYALTDLPDEGFGGPYQLVNWSVDGVPVTGRFDEPQDLVDLLNAADATGGWRLDLASKSIVGGDAAKQYSRLDILQETTGTTASAEVRTRATGGQASFSFAAGTHVLEVSDGGTVLERIDIVVTCDATGSTVRDVSLAIPGSELVCFDLSALSGPVQASSVTITPAAVHSTITLADNDCFRVSAKSVGTDSVTVRYCDAANNCATGRLAIASRLGKAIVPVTVRDSVVVPTQIKTYCLDTTELPGTVISVVDLCETAERTFVDFTYVPASKCVKYRGLNSGGTDSTCIVLCDDLGFCDTTKIIVSTIDPQPLPPQDLVFTIDRGTSGLAKLDIESFGVRPTTLENVCLDQSGRLVVFTLNEEELSAGFDGLEVGTERACVQAKASDGMTQLFNITVNVITRTPSRDTIRIRRGDTQTWCFSEPELIGPALDLYDDCPSAAPKVATATTDEIACLDFTATAVGTQDLCINVCDSTGGCDLTNLVIVVTEDPVPNAPVAVDDQATVPPTGTVTVDVLANDRSETEITSIIVVRAPGGGTASFDASRQLIYVRAAGVPCANDSLVYQICNVSGCARATVRLNLSCENGGSNGRGPISVTQLLSPNDDGINDRWIINNIEQYPDNTVKIYNRWGSRVFATKRYDNTWAGDFQDGGPLPDGTYFYVVEIEGGSVISNFLELRR